MDVAFAAESHADAREEQGPLDRPDDEPDRQGQEDPDPVRGDSLVTLGDRDPKEEEEQEFLDSLKLDGFPISEQERRKAWLQLSRPVRLAIRRMHLMFGHAPKTILLLSLIHI